MHPNLEIRLMRHYIDHMNPPQPKRVKHSFAWTAVLCFLALAAAVSALAAI